MVWADSYRISRALQYSGNNYMAYLFFAYKAFTFFGYPFQDIQLNKQEAC
jgi:hypothetical protein